MPPSPVLRVSPGRELKLENHKRGRSLESGTLYLEKEEDLALFNEVRSKERDDFLLQSNDNFDDFFSTKLRHFSDYKLGISIPARGESSDLLNAERDKNDYDWLITPPETPLFRSLDDEAQPVKRAPRGRPRSQPVSISRSPKMEKDYRSGRGSASVHRLSPSPRSGNSTLQSRSRPFSGTHSSPPPTMQHPSPARRLSPPPTKPTSSPRSSSPTPKRMSTGSTRTSSPSRVRGSSPIKTAQGNSTSPKIKAWQTNIPGFSSEAPPNLRTSLVDRPASYVRGASPSSRNGSGNGRQSMSPTASRSVALSRNHDRDPFSPYSKGSVASSGDDDLESPQSIPLSSSGQSVQRNMVAYPSNNAMSFSRKPTKKLPSSAPKRSLDLARQLDRRCPQDMFRPLLSSVPSSTFHAGKTTAHHRSLISRNSSMTSSSNASSDQAAGGVRDTEVSELNQEDVTSDCVAGHYPDTDDEVFVMEHIDALNEDIENRIMDSSHGGQLGENDVPLTVVSLLDVGSSNRLEATIAMDSPVMVLDRKHDYSDADGAPDTVTCSMCGRVFHSAEVVMEGYLQLCLECRSELRSTITDTPKIVMVDQNNAQDALQIRRGSDEGLNQSASVSECLLQVPCTGQTRRNHLDSQNSYSDSSQSFSVELFEEGELTLASQKVIKQQLQQDRIKSSSRLDVSDGAGISLLLKRSSSLKGHIVQSRSFTASTTSYDDFSYVRDSVNSMRSSIERTSGSVSSSIDLGSSRQTEVHNLWQASWRKSDTENYRYEIPSKHKRSASSVSSASGYINKELGEETCVDLHERSLASEFAEAESTCSDIESNSAFKTASELSSHVMNDHSGDTPVHSALISQEPASHENNGNLMKKSLNLSNEETSSVHTLTSNQVYDATPDSCADRVDVAEVCTQISLNAISEIEIENDDVAYYDSHSDVDSTDSKGCTYEIQHHDAGSVTETVEDLQISHHAHGVLVTEESQIPLEDIGRAKAKSLTPEEAPDVILFCSSIVHNLAHEAANIAIDNEALPVEVLQPAVTFVGKSNFERRDTRQRKCSSRSQKAQKKSLDMETTPSCNTETNVKSSPRIVGPPDNEAPDDGDSMKPPKLESKCNCTIM